MVGGKASIVPSRLFSEHLISEMATNDAELIYLYSL